MFKSQNRIENLPLLSCFGLWLHQFVQLSKLIEWDTLRLVHLTVCILK